MIAPARATRRPPAGTAGRGRAQAGAWAGAVAAIVLAILGRPAAALADDVKKMRFAERRGDLTVSTTFTEIFDKKAYDKLKSGFPSVIIVRMYVYGKGESLPTAVTGATFRIVYDLWDEVYVIRRETPQGRQEARIERRADALIAVTELDRFPIASLADIDIGPLYYFVMQVELNPVTTEELAEMRRWLSRPAGSTSIDRGSSFFGSFVSVFVNPKLPEADRVLRIRSQDFYRVER